MNKFRHDDSGGDVKLTDKDLAHIREEIDDLDDLLLTCRDSGLWRELSRVRRHLADELAARRRLPIGDDPSTWYDYEIIPLYVDASAIGWRLRLLEDGVTVDGRVFPVNIKDGTFLPWWTSQTEGEQAHWLLRTATGSAAEAYLIYLLDKAWGEATQAAAEWLDSRPEEGAEDEPS